MSFLSAKHFHNEAAAFAELESILWPKGPVCPHCGARNRVYELKDVRSKPSIKNPKGAPRYGLKKCAHCHWQFTVRAGTIFENSHAPLHKWFQAIHLICASKKGISSHQLHWIIETDYNSTWRMARRIRKAMQPGSIRPPMPGKGEGKNTRTQRRKFIDAAREHGADGDAATFRKAVRRIAIAPASKDKVAKKPVAGRLSSELQASGVVSRPDR